MKFPNRFLSAVFMTLSLVFFATAGHAQDPADDFLKAYFLLQDGDTAKKAGEKDKAVEKYNGALDVLRRIQVETPDWNPNIINFRIKYCTENVTGLGGMPSTGASSPKPAPSESTSAPSEPTVTAVAGEVSSVKLTEIQNELKQTRQLLEQIRKEKDDLQVKLTSVEESLKSVTAGKADARLLELQKANDDLRQKLGDAEEKLKGLSSEGVAQLQQELTETKKQLNAALQENDKLRKDN